MPQTPADPQHRKRELRLKIGRLRRRIDGRVRAARQRSERLFTWQTVVRGLPGSSLMAAFGVGLALAAGLSARSMARWFGLRLLRQSLRNGRHALWSELGRIWAASSPRSAASEESARHE
ncbi:MAG: hypothetical protein U1E05_27595 [Patescibacteria group bacterium]|nr:hypothetical protein [Patescibacteria group bacterium]